MSSFVLSLDQGTTSSRALLFDREGNITGSAQQEFPQIFPRPGWVEHDPREIWASQLATMEKVLGEAGPQEVAAIGITNQRETTVLWDRATGEPIHNAIVWQDRRTAAMIDRLREDGMEDVVRSRTGLVPDPYFSGTKLSWLLDHVDGARERAERGELAFGTVDTWLVWNLTKGERHITDVSNASRTMLFDIGKLDWDRELLDYLRIPSAVLPEVVSTGGVHAEVASGLPGAGLPIAALAGDQHAALFGQQCFEQGGIKNTYGTGCFMLMNLGDQLPAPHEKLLTTVAWQRDGSIRYAREGSIFVGGAVIQWLRDGLGILAESSDVLPLAESVEDSGDVVFVPAFAGLGAPHWDSRARGAIHGITRGTTAAHIARAAVESIAFQSADLFDAISADSDSPITELKVDGGATRDPLLLQFQADLLQIPVLRPKVIETTALGAAYLAGLAVGFWSSTEELSSQQRIDRTFEPSMPTDRARELRERWNEAVRRSLDWARD
ncbi:glycerol kinase [Haloferula helveola]|uniref:Glycerol kinase n=1 Tax=Haloferula helveola TaxID=490095 RepID=A0ABM7RE41_9BACT|nr:glycerol kinase [Haloferula helveola]